MSFIIAMAGKGGTGKTTVAGMLLRYLVEHGKNPVLAVDADANSNFNEVLGLEVDHTVGEAREEMKKGGGQVDMTKDQLIEMRINQCLVEADGFDLLAMGRPEGPGCYCAANNILRTSVDRLSDAYDYVVIDNEAGLEHLSRRTTQDVDLLVIVSDPSLRGIIAAGRVAELVDELKTAVGEAYLLVNRVNGEELPEPLTRAIEEHKLKLGGLLPADPAVNELDALGEPITKLPLDSPMRSKLEAFLTSLNGGL